jgi:hypothetical protein
VLIELSGGIQEDAPSLGKPEAVAAGTMRLVGTQRERSVAAAARQDQIDGSEDSSARTPGHRDTTDVCYARQVEIVYHPEADREIMALAALEYVAMRNALEKLELFGDRLGFPHSSQLKGAR